MNLLVAPGFRSAPTTAAALSSSLTYRELLCEPRYLASQPAAGRLGAGLHPTPGLHDSGHVPARGRRVLEDRLDHPRRRPQYSTPGCALRGLVRPGPSDAAFMQTRGVASTEATPIQKLLIGLPDGNNHCFFNETGEVRRTLRPGCGYRTFPPGQQLPELRRRFQGQPARRCAHHHLVDGPICANRSGAMCLTMARGCAAVLSRLGR